MGHVAGWVNSASGGARLSSRPGSRLWSGSIRKLLVILVSIPLAAVAVSAGSSAASSLRSVKAASGTVAAVRLVAQVDAARTAVEGEVLPTLAASIVQHPVLAEQYGLSSSAQLFVRQNFPASVVAAKQSMAVRALAAIDLRGAPRELIDAVEAVRREAADARRAAMAGQSSAVGDYTRQEALLDALVAAERSEADGILAAQLSPTGEQAVQQLDLVVSAVAAAGQETPAYLGTVFNPTHSTGAQGSWLKAWKIYEAAASDAGARLSGSLSTEWRQIAAMPQSNQFEALVDPTAAHGGGSDLAAVFTIAADSIVRDAALNGLLAHASTLALSAAASSRSAVGSRLTVSLAESTALILGSLLVAILASSAISRPVRRLAAEAEEVSRGNLIEVRPGGPLEVRVAGEALAATVGSLRRIETQASALAEGRLDSSLLRDALPGPLGQVVHASVSRIIATINEREALQSELAHQAAHDPLTSLPNRSAAVRHIEAALARARRTSQSVGLLFVDLDGFKTVNDTFGHAAGDQTLRAVAERMRSSARAGDLVCRLGGDEFVVVIEGAESAAAIIETARGLAQAASRPVQFDAAEIEIGASVGVAISARGEGDADTLLGEADAAVYRAKAAGRGQVEVFDDELRRELHERAELERAIRIGLGAAEFALHYQPVVTVASGEVQGYEALIRWHRPGHGLVMPDAFIPIAEQSSLINDLGRWVLHEALAQLRLWREEAAPGKSPPNLAINLSGRQLASPKLVDDVAGAIARYGVNPSDVTLELTETVLVAESAAVDRLIALKALGVRIALDDFGTGFTSIAQLGRFPIDVLKIDRSFVASMATSDHLVRMMIQVAHTCALEVVAEGVEEATQLETLRQLDCDAVQGYFFAKPLPADDLEPTTTYLNTAAFAAR